MLFFDKNPHLNNYFAVTAFLPLICELQVLTFSKDPTKFVPWYIIKTDGYGQSNISL